MIPKVEIEKPSRDVGYPEMTIEKVYALPVTQPTNRVKG